MCGIGGVYYFKEKNIPTEVKNALYKMKEFMHLRGPDASEYKSHDQVALVHTRLSIIDPNARSSQPMESINWLISFNGEIINFLSIKEELKNKYQFHTNSDTEVLLLAIEEWGLDKAIAKCAGMFAFLAYNKTTKTLYAVRDRLGIKPLFYFNENKESMWFASTSAAIATARPKNEWSENRRAIGSYFALGAPFTSQSSISNIKQVPPASYLTVNIDGSSSITGYWEPVYQPNFTMDDLTQIVQEYKVSDVKSALFMSGGIDSTFLASIMNDMDFFHLDSSERAYAKRVAKKYDCPLIIVRPQVEQYAKGIEKVCSTFGEPLMSCGIPFSVSYEAMKKGYKMAISANGADELFFGYPRTPIVDDSIRLPSFEDISNRWLFEQIAHIFRDKRNFTIPEYQDVIPCHVEIGLSLIKKSQLTNFPTCASYRWLEILTYVINDLNPTLDAASMANSLEVRVPFLDHRIVQGVLSWPANKICTREFGRKSPLKQYLSTDFNSRFLNRPKLGFSVNGTILSKIHALSDTSFKKWGQNGIIKMNRQSASQYFQRDKIYMKNIMYVHSIWKKSAPLNMDNNL